MSESSPARRIGAVVALLLVVTAWSPPLQRQVEAHPPLAPLAPCLAPPDSPSGVTATVDLTTVELNWTRASGSPTGYIVEAGSTWGESDLMATDTGSTTTSFTKTVPPGFYYARVRARNRCGTSRPSNELMVSVRLESTKPDVVVVPRGKTSAFFPTVERLRNGHLLVVYYDSPEHVSAAGRISMVRSVDTGLTWSAPEVVVDTPLDDRDPSIMQTRDGTLLISFFTFSDHVSNGVFVIRSDDEGQTWSVPVKVGTGLREASTDAKVVELDNGDLLIPLSGGTARSADSRFTVVRSTDQGRTWPADQEVDVAVVAGMDLVEPALASLGAGSLIAMIRSERADNSAYSTRSFDGGRSWSKPIKTTLAAEASDLLAVRAGDAPGHAAVVHTWGDFSGRFGEGRPTLVQLIDVGKPGDDPVFGQPHLVYHGRCQWGDESYPSSVLLPDRRVFTVYYDACAAHIGGTFTSLNVLRAKKK